jgi:hypothetical protein
MADHDVPEEVEQRLASLIRSVEPEDFDLEPVPEGLWAAIEAEAFARGAADGRDDVAEVVTIAGRRRARRLQALAVAAAVIVAVAVGAFAVARSGSGEAEVLAAAELSNDGLSPSAAGTRGDARLEERDGARFLELRLAGTPALGDAYLEVWLIDRAVEGMVSLGPYHGDGRYDIPASVDPGRFPVVDVSIEPIDGQPAHSGDSAVRGVLT